MWDLIVSVPDHCLSFYFVLASSRKLLTLTERSPFFSITGTVRSPTKSD